MEGKKRACVYTRVSTDAQGTEDKVSLSEQERISKMCIEIRGCEYIGTYTDNGYSGRTTERPALKRMMEDIKVGKIDVVFVYKLDRLSRKQKDALIIIEDVFEKNNVNIVSATEPEMDTTTPTGKAVIGIMAVFSQLESDTIAARTKMGRYAVAKEGKYAGGKPPIGYKAVDGNLVIVPEEAEIVRLVFKLRSEGETLVGIKDYLNNNGYRTKKGNLFQHSAVKVILENEDTYRGNYRYGKEGSKNTHEPILTDEKAGAD